MGLRINSSNFLLNTMRGTNRSLNKSLQRLSTGKRINQASDDPSGLVIARQLQAQLGSMRTAMDNTERAGNVLGTADAALGEVSRQLIDMRQNIIAGLNTQGGSQQAAVQSAIDASVSAIDRIGASTRFGGLNLLGGQSAITTDNVDAAFTDINVSQTNMGNQDSIDVQMNVTAAATKATVTAANAGTDVLVNGGEANFTVNGPDGVANFTLADGATGSDFLNAVNSTTSVTGVTAVDNGSIDIESQNYGSSQTFRITTTGGSGTFSPANPVTATGTDIEGTIAGAPINADGNDIRLNSNAVTAELTVAEGTGVGQYNFTVDNSGLRFQLNTSATPSDQITVGIRQINSSTLGSSQGTLSSLMSGGANSLANNPEEALRIVDEAISQVSAERAQLGATQSNIFESNLDSLGIAFENLSLAESMISDLDFAKGIMDKSRDEILLKASISVLAQSNQLSKGILSLLQT